MNIIFSFLCAQVVSAYSKQLFSLNLRSQPICLSTIFAEHVGDCLAIQRRYFNIYFLNIHLSHYEVFAFFTANSCFNVDD